MTVPSVDLQAGPIEYEDTGGDGPVLVFLHGVAMNGTVWREVVAQLRADHRCIVPTLPLGGHRRPMRADADLSMAGHAAIVADLLERLDLHEVTLVQNDHASAQVLAGRRPARVARLVLSSCEAFDNYPPGLPGRMLGLVGRLPGGVNALVQPLRLRALRRTPLTFGWMAKHGIPDAVTDDWLAPLLGDRAIRRDVAKYLRSVDGGELLDAAAALPAFERPALVVWAAEDRVMPPEHGRRLAALLPRARHVEIPDSYTLIPEDQPAAFAGEIRAFVREATGAIAGAVA
jgi:pimeloyl-ACP methyl ester carboxylesterase